MSAQRRIEALRGTAVAIARGVAATCFAATSAFAGIGGSVQPAFPGGGANPMNVGDIKTATITIRNSSSAPNNTETVMVSDIRFTPSCGQDDGNDCLQPDTGVFFFTSMAGKTGTACAGVTFDPVADPTQPGRLILAPKNNGVVILGPANSASLNARQCIINANFTVLRVPTLDSTAGGALLTTNSLASARFRGQQTNLTGPAGGGATTPIVGPNLQIGKAPAAPGPTISAGQAATFTITVSNIGTGTAYQVSLTDPLPNVAGLAWSVSEQSPALGCTVQAGTPQTLSCAVFDLASAATVTIALTATTTAAACQQMINQASASAVNHKLDLSGPPQPFPPVLSIASNQARVTCGTPPPTVDLSISVTNGVTAITPGGASP